ncbi:MAG: lipoate--protein ligase family protein [Planctomycetota bacterium]
MNQGSTGRTLTLDVFSAAENMATDQALLQSVARDRKPTLRFYQWKQPTLSLGYFQRRCDADPLLPPSDDGDAVSVVRRSTGGGAIWHHHELTYSLTLPTDFAEMGARPDLYKLVHESIRRILEDRNINAQPFYEMGRSGARPAAKPGDESFLCFQRRTGEDLIVAGYKVLGSAQRRTRGSILQHGSLLLSASPHARALPGLAELTGSPVDAGALAEELTQCIAERLRVEFRAGELSQREQEDVEQIVNERFANSGWTDRR